MPMPHPILPDPVTLAARLASLLSGGDSARGAVTVLRREPSPYASTFPSEVVTCRIDGGEVLRLFCKYAAGMNHNAHGHRGGVAYEAEVYRSVLAPLGAPVPRFYGADPEGSGDACFLVLEYLEGSLQVNDSLDSIAMVEAARWLGRFHAAGQTFLGGVRGAPCLNVYDAAYYRGWARRTAEFAGAWHGHFPWLAALCERSEAALTPLLVAPPTVIHGEFYPRNVLYHRGAVYPVDWESAAVAAGVIDLVTLTDEWPDDIARACEAEYRRTRWPDGPPAGLDEAVAAARIYLLLRWLGDRPEWTGHESTLPSFERLRGEGERMGLI
jgi:hypothetical protein